MTLETYLIVCPLVFLAGLIDAIGGGGGLICVPTLEKVYKLKTKNAHATAIAIMFPLSVVSSTIYLLNNTQEQMKIKTAYHNL